MNSIEGGVLKFLCSFGAQHPLISTSMQVSMHMTIVWIQLYKLTDLKYTNIHNTRLYEGPEINSPSVSDGSWYAIYPTHTQTPSASL